jgi:hypothetical protein
VSGVPTGGTYKLSFGGQLTGNLAFGANAAAIQTALNGLSTIGAGGVVVTGTGPFVVTFTKYGLQGDITTSAVALTGGTAPTVAVVHGTKGTPSLGSTSRTATSKTVLDMYRRASVSIATSDSDNHYTPNGNLYHE